MARGPQHVRTAVDLGIQLADALAEVHGHGLVHGDVKPETVRVNPKGNAKLLESGLVPWTRGGRLRHPSSAQAEPDVALAIETTAYFSPEQARGEPFDERSDLFSLGAVLYELLTASSPFRKSTVAATMASVLDGTPRPRATSIPMCRRASMSWCGERSAKRRMNASRARRRSRPSFARSRGDPRHTVR